MGGIQRYLYGLCSEMVRGDIGVTVIAPQDNFRSANTADGFSIYPAAGGTPPDGGGNFQNDDAGTGIRVIRRRFHWPVVKPSWLSLYRWVKKQAEREKYDYIFCGKGLFEGRLARRIYKQTGVPYVVFTYAKEVNEWLGLGKTKRHLKQVIGDAELVVGINDMVRDKLMGELELDRNKFLKLTPGLDNFWFEAVDSEEVAGVLSKCEIKKPYVLSVGRLQARKGFDDLIEAFGKLDQVKFEDYQLVIVGDGPEEERLQAIVEQEWLNNNVVFLDDVNDRELRAFYAGAELFALTPKTVGEDVEGFGIVYLEAAAQGLPAVGTNSGGVSEAVKDGVTGVLVKEGDVELIGQALEKVLGDNELRNEYGSNAKSLAQKQGWADKVRVLKKKLEGKE